jgi:sulfatase maturation enzyme AslB (radical SAM superfamily)
MIGALPPVESEPKAGSVVGAGKKPRVRMDTLGIRYGSGWHGEERHDVLPYRWIAKRAVCHLRAPTLSSWLRVTAAHADAGAHRTLSVFVDGRPAGSHIIRDRFAPVLFPLAHAGEIEIVLAADRTFVPANDPRELGLMIRSIEVLDLAAGEAAIEGEGWYDFEDFEYFPFRWMAGRAQLVLPAQMRRQGRFAALPVCSDVENCDQVLEVLAEDTLVARIPLMFSWHVYEFALPISSDDAEPLDLTLSLNRLLPDRIRGADPRELGVRVGALAVHDDARRHGQVQRLHQVIAGAASAGDGRRARHPPTDEDLPADGDGWYWWEPHDLTPYRWMARRAGVSVPEGRRAGHRFLGIPVYSEYANLSQVLTVTIGGRRPTEIPVLNRWFEYQFELPPGAAGDLELTLSVNKLVPPAYCPGDWRDFGVRVGRFTFHDDRERFERARWTYENAVRNRRELDAGATVLESHPIGLGIDLFGKCNITPACVYCPWDKMKALEGGSVDAVVNEATLDGYGRFFDGPGTLVNCSFGEPLLHPRFAELLDFFARRDKTLEISTNGQAFSSATMHALAGRRVKLFVSLDSASAETYRRLRNNRWHDVIAGLTVLREVRRRARGLPTLNMVFMPMRSNVHELEAFVRLCRMVEADTLMLRPLQLETSGATVERGGHVYDYAAEQLGPDELTKVLDACDRWCRQYGVRLVKQFDFGRTEPEQRHLDEGGQP